MDFFEIFQSNGQNQQMNVHLCNLQMNKYGERVLSCIRSGMSNPSPGGQMYFRV